MRSHVIGPFTARWHELSIADTFADPARCAEFRAEIVALQKILRRFTRARADMARVEDLTSLECTAD